MTDPSTASIIVALIGLFGVIIGGGLKLMWDVRGIKSGVHETREQVQNSHEENFRDDIDNKHVEQMAALSVITDRLDKSDRRQWKAINKQNIKIERLIKKK